MKKAFSLCIVVITLACVIIGCATSTEKSKEIKKGMSKNEVLKIMGKPKDVQKNDYGDEAWLYFFIGGYRAFSTVIWFFQENVELVTEYDSVTETGEYKKIDWSNSPRSLEEKKLYEEQKRAEREQAETRQKAERDQAKKAEQVKLAELYRQAGNNLGNLRNTTKRYRRIVIGGHYLTTTYDFGDGQYIEQSIFEDGGKWSQTSGTFRVNGNTVILLSSEGEYIIGTIVGNTLQIDGNIYR